MSGSKLYSDRLLSYWDPSLFGFKHESYTHGASEVSQLCGDEVEYRLIINNNVLEIVDVWREAAASRSAVPRCSPNWPAERPWIGARIPRP